MSVAVEQAGLRTRFVTMKRGTRSMRLALGAIIAAGMLVRLWGVTGSLWLDEFSTLWVVEAGLRGVAARTLSFQGQSPLYYWLVAALTNVLGESELSLRLLSLVASLLTAFACGMAGQLLAGRRTAVCSFAFSWLAFAPVQVSVNARPYALALLGIGMATAGYAGCLVRGHTTWRVMVIAGSALAFWSHFLLALPCACGLAAHVILAGPDSRYSRTRAIADGLAVAVLCLPAWPWLMAAVHRPQHVTWLDRPRHLDFGLLLAPFLLPMLMSAVPTADSRRLFTRVAYASIVGPVLILELLLLTGANLVVARYLMPIVVPAAVLAGVAGARLSARDFAVAWAAFLTITATAHIRTFLATGSPSGIGVEDWRSATGALRRATGERGIPLLYRSGFVEDANVTRGENTPATQSPLRGPGEIGIPWTVINLPYSWGDENRSRYFSDRVTPVLSGAEEFAVLCQHAVESSSGDYTSNLLRWIDTSFPATFERRPGPRTRGVDLWLFVRKSRRAVSEPRPLRSNAASAF
jgi:hypothetical protein